MLDMIKDMVVCSSLIREDNPIKVREIPVEVNIVGIGSSGEKLASILQR
jgi:hypothetical protein